LQRLVQRVAVDACLQPADNAEPILQANDRSVIEAEQVRREIAEVSDAEIAREAMRESRVRLVSRERTSGRQVDQVELDLGICRRRRRRILRERSCDGCGDEEKAEEGRTHRLWPERNRHARHRCAFCARFPTACARALRRG
jgi:hypothetical protein